MTDNVQKRLDAIRARQERWLTLENTGELPETSAWLAKGLILDDLSFLMGYIEVGLKLEGA